VPILFKRDAVFLFSTPLSLDSTDGIRSNVRS
jgi:hypothetical protein